MALTMGPNPFQPVGPGMMAPGFYHGVPPFTSFGGVAPLAYASAPPPGSLNLVAQPQKFTPVMTASSIAPSSTTWSITEALSLGDGDVCENIGEVIVRCEESLESGPVATLPPRSQVTILMISGRRALVKAGSLVGWISTRSAEGVPLIQRCPGGAKVPPSERGTLRGRGGEPNLMSEIQNVMLPDKLEYVPSGYGSRVRDGPPQRPKIAQTKLPTGIDLTITAGDECTNYHEMVVTEEEDEQSTVLTTLPPNSKIGIEEVCGSRALIRIGSLEGWVSLFDTADPNMAFLIKTSGLKVPISGGTAAFAAAPPNYPGFGASASSPGVMGAPPLGNSNLFFPGGQFGPMQPGHQVARGHHRSMHGPLPSWGPELLPPQRIGDHPPDPHLWEPFPDVGYHHHIPSSWVNYRRVLEDTNDEWEKRALNEPTIYRDYSTCRATTRSLMLKRHQFDLPSDASTGVRRAPPDDNATLDDEELQRAQEEHDRLAEEDLDQQPVKSDFGKQWTQHGKLFMTLQDPKHPPQDHFKISRKQEVETYAGVLMASKSKGDRDNDACTFA